MKQFARWTVLAALAVPAAIVWSDAPGDRGATTVPTSRPIAGGPRLGLGMRGEGGSRDGGPRDGLGGGPPRGDGMGAGRRWRDGAVANADDWAEVEQFMRVNSPVRIDMLKKIEDDLGPDRPIAQVVRGRLVQRFRDLERKRNDNADLYTFAVKQLQSEDAVLGTLRDARAPNADPTAIESRLDQQVRAFVDNNLSERQARIDRLKQILDAQTSSLDKDRGSIDTLVATQRDKFKKEMDAMLNFPGKGDDASTTKPTSRPTT